MKIRISNHKHIVMQIKLMLLLLLFNGDVGNVKTWMYLPYQVATCRECNKRCCSYWSMERESAEISVKR